ncbi:hypothetical protein [Hahella sp. CCB-MM4]|uniref:3'-5' exonuclease n=1 Tax=Hahella sp. (strain CCB-MM4) TaxID=1926491 RepID=UPI000B9BE5F2|nr:hypothetical protein [Hahella sp. CCB-MM4]
MKEQQGQVFEAESSPKDRVAPCFIDFEASSLDLICSYPIEVAVCLPDGIIHSWLLKPAPLWRDWSPEAEKIHGISRDQLEADGHNVIDVAHALNELIPEVTYCDALAFDSFWLHRLYKAAKLECRFRLESISHILTPQQMNNWVDVRRSVIDELGVDTHRAANDTQILYRTWQKISL